MRRDQPSRWLDLALAAWVMLAAGFFLVVQLIPLRPETAVELQVVMRFVYVVVLVLCFAAAAIRVMRSLNREG